MRLRALLPVALLALPGAAAGQWASVGATVQDYRVGETSGVLLRQALLVATPFQAGLALPGSGEVTVAGGWARGTLVLSNGARVELSGITDTEVAAAVAVGPFRIGATALIPSGRAGQTLDEAALVGVLSGELLPFQFSRWGTGGAVGGELAIQSRPWQGRVHISAAAGYLTTLEHEILDGESYLYRPGDRLSGRLMVDVEVGAEGVLSLLGGYQHYQDDSFEGVNLFQPGARLQGRVSYAFPVGPGESLLFFGGFDRRSEALLPRLGDAWEAPGIAGLVRPAARMLVLLGAEGRLDRGSFAVVPEVGFRTFTSDTGEGEGWLASAGAAVDWILPFRPGGRRTLLTPFLRARVGGLTETPGFESGLLGWQAGFTFHLLGGGR